MKTYNLLILFWLIVFIAVWLAFSSCTESTFSPYEIEQRTDRFDDGRYLTSTIVWQIYPEIDLIAKMVVCESKDPILLNWKKDPTYWYVKEITDSVKIAQLAYAERVLSKHKNKIQKYKSK